jgi:diaminopimelate epimerase
MHLQFTKMHGIGNDFVVINAIAQHVALSPAQLRFIADRHIGIGCDQILLVEATDQPGVDFRYRIFNADGGEVEQCGNGARCFARFVRDQGLTNKTVITVETKSGKLVLHVQADGQVTVNMGIPEFTPTKIPFVADHPASRYPLEVDGHNFSIGALALGNPHAVLQVDDVELAPVAQWGPAIEQHSRFPKRVNVGFLQIVSRDEFKLRVYERGTGETLACGSGACAAMVIGRSWDLLNETAQARLRGGTLILKWQGPGTPVMMTGPAQTVYEGSIEL